MVDYSSMLQKYLPQASNQQRNQITQALMNIQNPPPRAMMPPQPNAAGVPAPGAGTPGQAQTPGAPTPPIGGPPGPMGPAAPPTPGQGLAPTPGLMPQSMGQSMQPGGMTPGGPNMAPPPIVGQPPVPQTPNMVPPPGLGSGQVY
jgi:hypothetical protein